MASVGSDFLDRLERVSDKDEVLLADNDSAVRPPLRPTWTAFATHNEGWCSTAEPVASLRPLAAYVRRLPGQPLAEFSVAWSSAA
jgi:hypothetical protein